MDLGGIDLGGALGSSTNNAAASDLNQALTRFCAQHNKAQLNPELDLVKQQLRRVEDAVHILQVSMPRVEQALKEGETHSQQVEIQISGLKKQTTGLEQSMQTKAGNDQVMQAEKMLSSLQKSVNELSQAHVVHKEGVTAQKKLLDSSVSSLQTKFTEFGQSLRSNSDRLNLLDTKTSQLDNHMEDLQLLMQERVQTSELMKVKGAVEGLQMHLADLRQSVHRDGLSMNDRAEALETATAAASRQLEDVQILLQDRAHIDDMQQVKGTIDGLTSHIAILETSLEDTASAQKKLVDGQVSNLTTRLTELGHTARSSADQLHELQSSSVKAEAQLEDLQLLMQERVQISELHKVKGTVDGLQLKLAYLEQAAQQESRALQERGEQLDNLNSKSERQFDELFRATEERALLSQVSQFNGIVLDLEKQLAEARTMLQDKASMTIVQQVEGSLATLRQQATDQAVEAKTTLDQVQQLSRTLSTTHVKLSAVQEAMHSKADSDSVEQLTNSVSSLHTRTPGLQEEIQACLDRIRVFENTSATLSRQVSKAETLLQRKADSHDVEQLLSSVTTLESSMPGAEEEIQACMDRMHDFESTVASLSRQLSAAETVVEGKVDAIQIQHVDLAISEAQAKLGLVEQLMLDKVHELGSLLGGVDARHSELEQCLHDKAGHNQVQHLSDLVNSMEIKLVDRTGQQSMVQQLEELLSQAHARIELIEAGMSEKAGHFQVQQLRTLLSGMESRVNMVEGAFQDKADHETLQQLQEMLSSLEARLVDAIAEQAAELSAMPSQMESLAQGLEEMRDLHQQEMQKVSRNQQSMVGASQVQELRGSHTATEAKLHRLEQAVQDKASGAAVQQLQGRVDAIADQASNMNTVSPSQLQGLEEVCMKVQVRLSQVERDSAERVNLGQIQQIKSLVAGLEEKMTCMEGTMHEKAGMLLVQQLQDLVTGLEEQVCECMGKQARMSGSLEQQPNNPHFERTLTDVQNKVFEVEHLLQEKVGINQIQILREAVASLETRLESPGTQASTTGSGQMQQLESVVMLMQAQLADVEHSLEEKVGMEQVQSLKNMLTSFQSQVTNLEQNMQGQVGGGIQLQQLRNQISTLEMKLAGMKSNEGGPDRSHSAGPGGGGVQGGGDLQQLTEEVGGLQTKVSGIKRGVWEVVDCVQTVEGAIAALKTQTANIEQTLTEKAGCGQVQQLCDTVDAMKAKIVGIDQMVRTGADRVREVEGAVMSVGSQLTGFKQVFYDGQSNGSPNSRLLLGLDDNMR